MVFQNKRQRDALKYKNSKYKRKNYKGGKVRKEINKKTKVHLVFDPDSRQEFLGGFQKRKQERKAYHKARLAKQLVEEKQKIRAEAKQSVGKLSSSHSILPELEGLLSVPEETTESYDVGNVTVSITSLEAIHQNVPERPESGSDEEMDTKVDPQDIDSNLGHGIQAKLRTAPQGKNMKSVLNKETNRILQQTKAYKASQRLKQKSRKFKGKNKRKGDKSTGEAGPPGRDGAHSKKKKGEKPIKNKTKRKSAKMSKARK